MTKKTKTEWTDLKTVLTEVEQVRVGDEVVFGPTRKTWRVTEVRREGRARDIDSYRKMLSERYSNVPPISLVPTFVVRYENDEGAPGHLWLDPGTLVEVVFDPPDEEAAE